MPLDEETYELERDYISDQEEWEASNGGGYLTMARIMGKGWTEWSDKNLRPDDIGHTIIRAESAYKAGFLAGFEGRYFRESEE